MINNELQKILCGQINTPSAPPAPRRPTRFLQAGGDAQRRADRREDGHQRLDDHFPN